jgi:histidine triad (HIT) family protein
MSSIFTKILNGDIPSYRIAENDKFFAFLDINPLAKGHTLVIPKKEVDYILNLDDELHADLWNFAKKVGKAVEKVVECKRIGLTVIGLEVPHTHIHVIPINTIYDMDFKKEKLKFSDDEFKFISERISEEYLKL